MPATLSTSTVHEQSVQHFEPNLQEVSQPASNNPHTIVIGSGPIGMRFVNELLKRQPQANVTLFGNEPYQPYNRVQLSSVLAGDVDRDDIHLDMPDDAHHPGFSYIVSTIRDIDTEQKQLTDTLGITYFYHHLVIATGSRAHVPNIPGTALTGVYTFRSLKDTEALYARISSSKHIVVVGGGLLGIEAARGLRRFNTKVTLIHQSHRLMNRQLDDTAAQMVADKVAALGIEVLTDSGVQAVDGDARVTGVTTRYGEKIDCDTVLFCTGISANSQLAMAAKIKINRGILVDDQLQTSAKDIYAIGECCEHNGMTYGLVKPGLEQAAVAADAICQGQANYLGSLEVSQLKVAGEHVCSMGEVTELRQRPFLQELVSHNPANATYRKLILHRGKLIGAIGIGEWPELRRIQELYQFQRFVWPWQRLHFRLSGQLWIGKGTEDVNLWPKNAIVCQCNNVNQGTLVDAIDGGSSNLSSLSITTSAGSTCGSCKPLLNQLLGYQGPVNKEKAWLPVLLASLISIVVACIIAFLPAWNVSDSVQVANPLEGIWNDKFWKQVTGFSLLGMSLAGMLMSIRKRLASKRLGDFAYWRVLHTVLGVFCISTLILHTGLHLGSNLNQMLMINFLAIVTLGALAGLAVALSHNLRPANSQKIRKWIAWAHIFVTWPLPILLGAHIITVYYF